MGYAYYEVVLLLYAGYGDVHVVDLLRVKPEAVAAVYERLGVHRLLVCLPEQVLPALRVCYVPVN